jgi:predicted PurR-regulated permease PerM
MRGGWLRHVRRTHTLWHLTAYLAFAAMVFVFLRHLGPVLTPLLAAAGIAYLLDPLVERLARRGIPRAGAVALILVGFGIVFLAAVTILVPLVAHDMRRFVPELPRLGARAAIWIETTFGIDLPETWREAAATGGEQLKKYAASATGPIVRAIVVTLGGVFSFFAGLIGLLLIPVFAFYFLVDWPRLVGAATELVPPRRRDAILDLVREIDGVVSTWIRGQLTVVAIEVVLFSVALSIVGIHLAVPIGIVAGILSVIPYLGMIVGLGLALLMAVLDWHGIPRVLGVCGVFAGVQLLEGLVLVPTLVGRKVGLSEAAALFAAVAGAELLGFTGMLLAIPLAAAVAVLVRRAVTYYRESEFFTYGSHVDEPDEPAESTGSPGP